MITLITDVKVRETIINVALKRFTSVIRTIRRQTVANVRKSYPQVIHRLVNATQSYPQVIHKLSTGGGERVFGGEGAGGERVFESPST